MALGGGYGGPPEGGGNPGGGGGNLEGGGANPPPILAAGPQVLAVNSGLKGIMPTNFDKNCKNTKQFISEFALYCMINQNSTTMRNTYTCTTLALSFMQGPSINDWVMQ